MTLTCRSRFIVCASGVLAAAAWAVAAPLGPTAAAAPDDVVAIVAGVPVRRAELDAAAAARVAQLEEQAHQVRLDVLEGLIADRLLTQEAARRGTTVDRVLEAEVTAKAAPVAEPEIDEFIARNRERLPADLDAVRPQVRRYLEQARTADARGTLLSRLKAEAGVSVLLAAPAPYRAQVSTADAPTRGAAAAAVTIVEFADFDCPYCRSVQATLDRLLAKYPTQVRLAYKFYPIESLHPHARRLAEAGWCAARQEKFWPFHGLLQAAAVSDRSDAGLWRAAAGVGIEESAFRDCLSSRQARAAVQAHIDEGTRLGITGTPAFLVNGRIVTGALPFEMFATLVEEELARERADTAR